MVNWKNTLKKILSHTHIIQSIFTLYDRPVMVNDLVPQPIQFHLGTFLIFSVENVIVGVKIVVLMRSHSMPVVIYPYKVISVAYL